MIRLVAFVVLLTVAYRAPAQAPEAVSPEEKGRTIAAEADRRDAGFGDTVVEITMTLVSADGRVRERRLTWRTLEVPSATEGDKSLTVFHEPRDIAGTAFLSVTHIDRPDDQWLYLPSLKRVKRIAAANQSSAFMGSEFSYEDLLSNEVEKFDYRWLRDEPCDLGQCFVLERRPRYRDSGYRREVLWLDQAEYRTVKTQYYDRDEELEKTLTFAGYREYLGRYWRAQELRMVNHQTQKQTVLAFGPYEFRSGLTDQDFDPSALDRLR